MVKFYTSSSSVFFSVEGSIRLFWTNENKLINEYKTIENQVEKVNT